MVGKEKRHTGSRCRERVSIYSQFDFRYLPDAMDTGR
jgi:hypothetical protein